MNAKWFNARRNDRKVDSNVSEFGIFVYKDFRYSDTKYKLSGTVARAFNLLIKSFLSLTYDGLCLTIG